MRNLWPSSLQAIRRVLLLFVCGFIPVAVFGAAAVTLAPADLLRGTSKAFEGLTRYELAEVDGRPAVRAVCDRSASGLIVRRRIDLRETPVIEWSWGIADTYDPSIDEASKAGDDFPARLLLIHSGGLTPMGSRAIAYVWASGRPAGADWINPYITQTRIVAVQSGTPERALPWVTHRRNLREDFRRYFGLDVAFIDAVAVMTDCDDRGARTEAWYGPVSFLPEDG